MRTVTVKALSAESFNKYGSYADFLHPAGERLGDFFRDPVLMTTSGRMPVAFSPLAVYKREMIVKSAEYHDYTPEVSMCIDDDVIVHLAPAGNDPCPEKTEAFLVPKGTLLCINPGVWHMAAFPVNMEEAHILIALPERTYHNDCTVVDYPENQWIRIVMS